MKKVVLKKTKTQKADVMTLVNGNGSMSLKQENELLRRIVVNQMLELAALRERV